MTKQSIFTELRNARIEQILNAKQSRVLTSPWMRRLLSIIAVISSYVVLATLLIPTPYTISKTNRIYADYELIEKNWLYGFRDISQGVALLLLIWSFVLLRMSMRRVTLLPDEYLDELQIANRDWAFKAGYLVVRRIGLGVALLFGFLATFGNAFVGFTAGYGPTPKTFRAIERYISDLSMEDPFGFYFKGFMLLAFVAYSFPLILLAWREARFTESVPEVQETKELSEKERNAKFYFSSLKWLVIFMAIYFSLALTPKLFMTFGGLFYLPLILLMYVGIPGSLILFTWASVTTAKSLIEVRKEGFKSTIQKRWANITTGFLTLTLVLGMTVGGSMMAIFARVDDNPRFWFLLPMALIAGLLMIPAQAISMTFYAKSDRE